LPSGDHVGDSENSGSWVSRATLVRCRRLASAPPAIQIALHVTTAAKTDSWLAAGTWDHSAKGTLPRRCGIARDTERRQRKAIGRIARPAGATEAGARSLGNADQRSRCGDQEDGWRERSLPTVGCDPWRRTGDGDRSHRGDWQRSGLPQGSRVRGLAGGSSARILNQRQAKAARHQQTWELLLAKTFHRCSEFAKRGSCTLGAPSRNRASADSRR
jgi:hypothetical protein